MIGEFAVLARQNGVPMFIEDLGDFGEAVKKANEIAESRNVPCFVYCYQERIWKYRADPRKSVAESGLTAAGRP